jgi:membrane protein DedA with SNARE-associated domain/rhodanese-related sulfurtransferase
MESLIAGLAVYGYGILFAAVFLEAVSLPVPAALALLIAGGASARGSMQSPLAVSGALAAMLTADMLMFLLGRYTGWWLLGLLCRLSLNPDSCILRSADLFYKRGRLMLVFAKFIPGINAIAPPMAGSMNMRLSQFLRLDLAGAILYVGAYFGAGYVFSDALDAITRGYHVFGRVVGWILIAAVVGYAAALVRRWIKSRSLSVGPLVKVPLVDPREAAQGMAAENAVIYDVRSHGYYDPRAMRIKGSRRLDPNALHQPTALHQNALPQNDLPQSEHEMPPDRKVYLYGTCISEATSSRVARELIQKGVRVAVIKGGLRKWKEAGLPMEPVPAEEISALPVFDR